jgi:hypothetical protein
VSFEVRPRRRRKERLQRFVFCWRSGAMAGFTVVESLWRREVEGGWMGFLGVSAK